MKNLLFYVKKRKNIIIVFSVFSIIYFVCFALYQLPFEAVLYPFLLCAFIGLTILGIDCKRFFEKHNALEKITTVTDALAENLPTSDSVYDEDYQKIIALICNEHNAYVNLESKRFSDMVDYYTVWAHQIKTPIASMRLNLQNQDTDLARKMTADLFRIEQYVEMVLAFLRLDTETTDYVFKSYSIDTIIKNSVKKFAGEFINRKIALVYEPTQETVITDDKWLSFVLEQIISNALKYTPCGSIKITVNGGKIIISDTGIGIAKEDLPRVFENGFTGYNGRTDKDASGIGLYLCSRICKKLGHKISVSSEIGKGTTVTVDVAQTKILIE